MGVFQALVFLIFQEGVEVDGQGVVAGDGLGSGTDNAGVGAAGRAMSGAGSSEASGESGFMPKSSRQTSSWV